MQSTDAAFHHATAVPTQGSGWLSFETVDLPIEFSVELSDRGRPLDRRSWSETEGRAPIDESSLEAQIAFWLMEGEGLQLEYKEKLGASHNREFAETVASYANGGGAIILLGVSDKAEVKGFAAERVRDTITNIIRAEVQEYIEVQTTSVTYDSKPIYVIQVPEGTRPPYQVGGKTFVRKGSTDRAATPAELRALVNTHAEADPGQLLRGRRLR